MVPGEGLVATPGAVDSHVHLSNADLVPAALSAGVTTLVGMGIGGVWDVGANPAPNLHTLMASWTGAPVNAAFLARGSSGSAELLERAVLAGAGGFKVHEDWGAGPDAVDTCLGVAEQADLPVALHTDTLNESGFLEDTLDAVGGRTVHAYHVEGGGGHPDLLRIVGRESVLTSSTTPTLPLTAATVRELGPMTMTVHRGHPDLPSDRTIAASRIREHAIAAENRLHDDGAISIINSDALGMGRIGETVRRTWQLAHVQAHLAGETGPDVANNARVLRYLAKLTHNPAVAHGLAGHVGSLRAGRVADIVLWSPAWFGAVPELVIKSGFVAWGAAGSGSGSTRLGQPRRMRGFHGARGGAPARLSHQFVAAACLDDPTARAALPARAALHRDRGQPGPRRRGHAVQHRDTGGRDPRRAGPGPGRRPRGAAAPRRRPAPDPAPPPGVRMPPVSDELEIDLLLRDADVLTLDDARPRGRAVAVHHGRVLAVLEDDELPAGVRARRVAGAGGATVVPGFDDAHQHTAWFGQSLAEIPLGGLRDLDAVYDAVAARAAELPPDAFVVGSGYDDVALGGSPDRRALDRAGGGRPVWLKHRSAHVCAVSTEVLARAGVLDGRAVVPAGGVIVRDDAGDPTGVLLEAAQALAGDLLRPYGVADLADAIARATAVFAREGLTHVTEAGIAGGWIGRSPRELAAYQLARERGDLAVRVDLMPETSVLHDVPGGAGPRPRPRACGRVSATSTCASAP